MKVSAYPSYKQPEAHWLEKVPTGWNSLAIGRLFRRVKRVGFEAEELLSVYRDYGVVPKSSRDDNFNTASEDLSPYQLVNPGELVLNKMKAWQGSIAISNHRGIVSPAYFVYEPWLRDDIRMYSRYIHYLLRSPLYITQYLSRSKGIRVNQWDLDPEAFQRIDVLLPSLDEQKQIAAFLDYETAKIDALIEKQQQLIALLGEKRQAVISHAVTKGLNPNAPMRDSDVEWLGYVPEHWKVCRLKHAMSFLTSGPRGWSDQISDQGSSVFLQSGDLNHELGLHLDTAKRINPPVNAEGIRTKMQVGDLVCCVTGANTGRIAVAPVMEQSVFVNQHLALIRPIQTIANPRFLATLMSASSTKTYFSLKQYGLKEGLSLTNVAETPICLPPISEQEQIVAYLNKTEYKMRRLRSFADDQVELLQERRTALISAAVTGKIDVRGWKPPTSDAKLETEMDVV